MTNTKKPGPVEVWLTSPEHGLSIRCTVVHDDESTDILDVDALSMRGAQREITGFFIRQGYEPAGRWEVEQVHVSEGPIETVRRFRPKQAKTS